jgi:hypothetical protein
MLMSIALLGFSLAVISKLTVLSTLSSVKLSNKSEGLEAARLALHRITTDVRHARYLGLQEGQQLIPPPGGFPSAPWNQNLNFSESVLVLQLPVFFESTANPSTSSLYDGMPLMLPRQQYGSYPTINSENFDLIIYQVIEDPTQNGLYSLQVARFPGYRPPGTRTIDGINPPQTILKGIIGPKIKGLQRPDVFKLTKSNSGVPGIAVDIELLQKPNRTNSQTTPTSQIIGVHAEEFLRANRSMTFNNI